ncbi:MAG: hypothetical protein ABIK28_25350 [Planctomycetota bacterium]
MKSFQIARSDNKTHNKRLWISVGALALIILGGVCAIPMPALVEGSQLSAKIDTLRQKHVYTTSVKRECAKLEKTIFPSFQNLSVAINHALPQVEHPMELRDLLLAQSEASGVEVEQCTFSPLAPSGYEVPGEWGWSTLGEIDIEIWGKSVLNNLFLFIGLMEATGDVYSIRNLDVSFPTTDKKLAAFRLNIKAYLRTDSGSPDFLSSGKKVGS